MNPRRQFLRTTATLGASLALGSLASAQTSASPSAQPKPADRPPPPPPLEKELVKAFVTAAHSDLPKTQAMLAEQPHLLNATWDWGHGDFETALGGASHMGRRDIVEYLLEHSARIGLFCAAMMGRLDAVKSFLTLQPKLIDAKGPHGFTLHFHAQVGGKEAEPVLDYLQSIKKLELKPVPFLKPAEKKPG